MLHSIGHDSKERGIVIALSGEVTGEDLRILCDQLIADESLIQSNYQIWDFSEVVKFDVSMAEIQYFAIQDSVVARHNPQQRVAIIPRKDQPSGLDQLFHVLGRVWGGCESRTFADINDAKKWVLSRRR